ncbi:putative web family protein [Quercus suber]|uniref:Web family protein n=1 Tax=Quercus suber TaxID=58331 RepID=A0AAW0LWG1_QUESU
MVEAKKEVTIILAAQLKDASDNLSKVVIGVVAAETTNEKYESMLNDAKHENDVLMNTIRQSKNEIENSKAEWEKKELHLVNCVKDQTKRTLLWKKK